MTLRTEIDAEGIVESTADVMGILSRRAKGDLKRFKEFIESRGVETGEWRGEVDPPNWQQN